MTLEHNKDIGCEWVGGQKGSERDKVEMRVEAQKDEEKRGRHSKIKGEAFDFNFDFMSFEGLVEETKIGGPQSPGFSTLSCAMTTEEAQSDQMVTPPKRFLQTSSTLNVICMTEIEFPSEEHRLPLCHI